MEQTQLKLSANCKLPTCIYNCCNQQGQCPSGPNQCSTPTKIDPIWLDIMIGVIVGIVLLGAVITLLIISRRRRQNNLDSSTILTDFQTKPEEKVIEMEDHSIKSQTKKSQSKKSKESDSKMSNPFQYIHPRELQYLRSKSQRKKSKISNYVMYSI